ncbi:TlpA family protein disulfide reductase [Candidatus Kaiserbacteria bacterium]|nr:TlpA family protein disulfide reductase [Candidatus Kaiserbacteria bacterium]
MKTTLIVLGVVVVIAAVFAWSRPTPQAAVHADAAADQTGSTLRPAPDFSLEKVGGGTITLADFRGKKPVILDFWTTWCPNCRRDMPRQNEWYKKYKDSVEVIGIDMQEDSSVVKAFVEKLSIVYPIALDPRAQATRSYNVIYTNYHVLVDKQGTVVKTIPGDISEQDFLSLINL